MGAARLNGTRMPAPEAVFEAADETGCMDAEMVSA
jgi:hypothetical protein